jgi:predicted CxxxxCH...CXXCH cytochrome family protein
LAWCAGIALTLAAGCSNEGLAPRAGTAGLARRSAATAAPACTGTGAHDKHAASGVGCQTCHPCGGALGFQLPFTYPGGTSTSGGAIVPATATTPASCSVGCHSPLGSPAHTVAWNAGPLDCTSCHDPSTFLPVHPALPQAPATALCLSCHDQGKHTRGTVTLVSHPAAWMDQASAGFHAYSANQGLAACQTCHRQDLSGGVTGFACGRCHDQNLPAGVASWKVNCVMCHGGTDNASGAPPKATWGQGADLVRIGAHTSHVSTAIAPPIACAICHVTPADALAAGHIDGPVATVALGGIAVNGVKPAPTWDRASATCSGTYCHGATLQDGSNRNPIWTRVGQGQASCSSCHGAPPLAPHPYTGSDMTVCAICHGRTMDASGKIIPPASGGLHLDGLVEASGHDVTWMDQASPGFHAFSANRGLGACQACHGATLDGGTAPTACANCHGATWKTNCLMCHGGVANSTGAPPKATWGNGADPVRTGAHTVHVTGSAIAGPMSCDACHVTPADALAPGHIDNSTATVTWSGVATTGGASPSWTRATATCASVYCHGNYSGTFSYIFGGTFSSSPFAGAKASPTWTGAPMACNSCHGNPPRNGYWHSGTHGNGANACEICHPDATGPSGVGIGITNKARHVDGKIDVAPRWRTTCYSCH